MEFGSLFVNRMKWPTNKEEHAYMRMRQEQNKRKSKSNPNENWAAKYLNKRTTGHRWKRQAQWGYRLYDFWCSTLGIAVEIDGDTHDPNYDRSRDEYNYNKSGIVVLRVRNRSEKDMKKALIKIQQSECWNTRRKRLGLKPIKVFPVTRPEG